MTLQNKAKKYPAITYLVYITFLTFERSEGSTMFVNEFIFLVISLVFLSTQPVHTARNIVAASKIVRDQLSKQHHFLLSSSPRTPRYNPPISNMNIKKIHDKRYTTINYRLLIK